ncbi:tripartite tricarboxylate transporter permease [Nocardioides daejeonensis]|uniref:tripartite tricarboxylate transporter permease n=1 Tax=Nocardioides daejeonensis TaxID=1046556 RepID=UPI000D749BCA|nr:tripartite tricarboxylate transporter permease [Nocardioides daejeonensis]
METINYLVDGLAAILTVKNLLLLSAGVLLGQIIGVMPGLGPTAGIAILLPLTFNADPTGAIIMLAAIYYGSMYGGTITAVLINTPGESATVATTFDGYPMAKKGRAGQALVIAAGASFMAGIVGAVLICVAAPLATRVTTSFGPPEIFLLVLAGLLTLVVIIDGSILLGLLSALLGFAIATVGLDVGTGAQRFTFGSPDLIGGIDFVPVAIGMFGVAEVLQALLRGEHRGPGSPVDSSGRLRDIWPNRQEVRESTGPAARGSVLGFFVGATPGAGATIASLMSYNLEKSISKEPERFGQGAPAGVAGPEAANNAAATGALVPMLSLGIPGSSSTAILLGAFLMWGLQPGPLLMEQNPEFAWGLIASMFLGNVMLLLINVFTIPVFASIAKVPLRYLATPIIVLATYGTYAINKSVLDVAVMLAAAVLGLFMRRFGMSCAALIIALVLGPLAEMSLRQTLIISDGSLGIFLERQASVVLLACLGAIFALPFAISRIRRRLSASSAKPSETDEPKLPTPLG